MAAGGAGERSVPRKCSAAFVNRLADIWRDRKRRTPRFLAKFRQSGRLMAGRPGVLADLCWIRPSRRDGSFPSPDSSSPLPAVKGTGSTPVLTQNKTVRIKKKWVVNRHAALSILVVVVFFIKSGIPADRRRSIESCWFNIDSTSCVCWHTQQTWDVDSTLANCWPSVHDAGPTVSQRWPILSSRYTNDRHIKRRHVHETCD